MRARGVHPTRGSALACFLVLALLAASCRDYFVLPDAPGGVLSDGAAPGDHANATEAGLPSDAAPTSPCAAPAPNVVFCDDFDTTPFGARWDDSSAALCALCSLDTNVGFSGSASMLVSFADAGRDETGHLTKRVPIPLDHDLRLAFELRVDQAADVYPFGIWFGDYSVTWNAGTGKVSESTNDASLPYSSHEGIAAPTGSWVHVELELSRAQGTGVFRLGEAFKTFTLDGAAFLKEDAVPGLFMGLFDAGAGTSWRAHIDDVVVSKL